MEFLELDYEYNRSRNADINLVCCSVRDRKAGWVESFWLHQDHDAQIVLTEFLSQFKKTHIFLSYAVIAEARSMINHGIADVADYKWFDLYVEWRALTNHNVNMQYGKQLIDGREVRTFPPKPKYEQTEEDKKKNHQKVQHSMAAAAYKLLGVKVDTDRKNQVRDIIIHGTPEEIEAAKDEIIEYCESDLDYLKPMLVAMLKEYKRILKPEDYANIQKDMLYRGEYSARTAMIEQIGYPISVEKTRNFADSVPSILKDIQLEVNDLFPEIKPFRFNKTTTKSRIGNTFSWNQGNTREWIKTLDQDIQDRWTRTNTGDFSLALDAFLKFFNYHHDFPKDNFGAQMVRFLKTKQNLNGFLPAKKGKKTLWDSVGEDGMVRPFLGIYGSQSSRNQPSATGFIFLKSAWVRALCVPPPGKAMCGCDFGSEEFLIGALESGDRKMIEAYMSNDPYLAFAKDAGAVPPDATKKSHGEVRNRFKSTVLGVSYLMGAKSLALKLTADTGTPHTEEEAQDLIDLFSEVYHVYDDYRNDIVDEYYYDGYLMLDDGWPMFGDNDNFRSIANMPVQGQGAVVLRRAVQYAQNAGLDIALTLHDALYILYDVDDLAAVDTLVECMQRAFKDCYEGSPVHHLANIRVDADVWSPEYKGLGKVTTPGGLTVKAQEIYIDERAVNEYNTFKQYFDNDVEELGRLL